MKKITALIITFALIFSFASCRKEEITPQGTTVSSVCSEKTTEVSSSETTSESSSSAKASSSQSSSSKVKQTTLRPTEKSTAAEIISTIISTAAKKTRPSTTRRNYFPNKTSTTEEETTTAKPTETTTRKQRTTESTEQPLTETTQSQQPKPVQTESKKRNTCTITVSCVQILNNPDSLKKEKEPFVPSNGYILETVEVEFENGETVFDVLKRVCAESTCSDNCTYCQNGGIQLEYEFTPGYDNYYIEGIHQIYEKDCGSKSGWMYKVNEIFPNYGCSDYVLKDGDNIEFVYTLNLGEDVGAEL